MECQQREYPLFSACGLNCGLCPRYQMEGASKCPGCFGEGFLTKHPKCGVLSCSLGRGLAYCGECDEFPCKKYDGADQYDSFITHLHQLRDLEKARRMGLAAYQKELDEKIALLEELLAGYNDGRQKSLFCLAVNLLELDDIKGAVEQIELEAPPALPIKERSAVALRLIRELAEARGLSLKLRAKPKAR